MGNDSSRLKGLLIDKNSVEANDFWTLYNAESPTTSTEDGRQLLSIFHGEPVVNGQLWVTQGPLERAIKNLMIYRHPYILKYVTTWDQGGHKHLATERVRPLNAVLSSQNNIQVCLGLRTILCSLIFLVEKAMGRHLNICIASIYITEGGSWRLAGFEYVWKHKELTKTLLDLVKSYRYAAAVDSSESAENNSDAIEQYAFATLCEEVLNNCSKKEATATPHVQEFRDYCAIHLKHNNAQLRPRLSAVLLHPYFNHEFVLIHSFLFELPLKSVQEKQAFFTGLIDRLRYFSEEIVGAQLAADLLSRMVLLDPTAQLCVTPYVLKTKTDYSAALFANQTYLRYVMPHIKKMFRLRDAQIRLILLEYFMEFVRLLSKDDLLEFILPYLLEGMNDTNDVLVAKTLRCLADLVPILGAANVIGGNRIRIFSDGRPQAAVPDSTTHWVEPRSITPVMGDNIDYMMSDSPLPDHMDLSGSFISLPHADTSEQLGMPPRLSPDGGEDDKSGVITDGIEGSFTQQVQAEVNGTNITDAAEQIDINDFVTTIIGESVNACIDARLNLTLNAPLSNTINGLHSRNVEISSDDDENGAWSDWETDEFQRLNKSTAADSYSTSDDFNYTKTAFRGDAKTSINPYTTLPSYSLETAPVQISPTPPSPSVQTLLLPNNYSQMLTVEAPKFVSHQRTPKSIVVPHNTRPPVIADDLSAFDIVVQKTADPLREQSSEFDFFKDMEPVIASSSGTSVAAFLAANSLSATSGTHPSKEDMEEILIDSNRLAALATNTGDPIAGGDGWGTDDDVMDSWKV